jgi:hypothetical protein
MNRPDAMDLDVAALLGVDVAKFVQAPAKATRATKVKRPAKAAPAARAIAAQRSPWLWVIVPLAAALVVGVGMTWRADKPAPPERTAVQALVPDPPFRAVEPSRAMSLRIIDGPRPASPPRPRPRNIPMAELGPAPTSVASQGLEAAPAPQAAQDQSTAPARILDIEPMSLFSDQELAPGAWSAPADAPEVVPTAP